MTDLFAEWLSEVTPQIQRVQEIMEVPLSDIPSELVAQLSKAEAWNARINTILATANGWLDTQEYTALMKIDRSLTVLERETRLRSDVVQYRKFRDIVEGLGDSLKSRISLGQSILRHATREASSVS